MAVVLSMFGCGPNGGPVAGAADTHCKAADGGTIVQAIDPASCHPDAGVSDAGEDMPDFGATLYNAEGDDDDCKYHVKFTSTAINQSAETTFTVTVTKKEDGSAATGAAVSAEVFLNEMHAAPNSGQKTTESAGGVYAVGPIKFDASGQWTVRFHISEECTDSEDSPHGHVAFFINVP
jgi:hypothetical protein